MLADPRAITLAQQLRLQWLNLAKLAEIKPDPAIFPYASGAGDLREDFREEIALFMDNIFRNDQSVLDLLDSHYTFLNERLALHYGINTRAGRPVPQGEARRIPRASGCWARAAC